MQPGTVIAGRFEVVSTAGAGGMSAVYRARDLHAGGEVALKLLEADSDVAVDRFTREAQLVADLVHPAIVRYVAHGRLPSGGRYLAMEWLEGQDLARRLLGGTLSREETLKLAGRVASALAAVHARGIVHRDVKPANLFLTGGRIESVKLIDFGLAHLERATQLTRTGQVLGTLGYMAPEQLRDASAIDARADVFALGCVIYACLAGVSPFGAGDDLTTATRILHDEPALASLPGGLRELVGRMLAKDRELRPRDGAAAAALIAALDEMHPRNLHFGASERRLISVVHVAGEAPRSVAFSSEGLATDRAARAARAALELAAAGPVAVVSGWAPAGLPDELVERARGLAREPGVAVDDVTAGLLGDRFEIAARGAGLSLGAERPVEPPRTLMGRATPFVGREREMASIEAAFAGCLDGQAAGVLVTAPAGAGKSRLRREIVARLTGRAEVWMARADEQRAGSPFALLASCLRRVAGIDHGDSPELMRRKLRARVGRHVVDADRVATFLGELAGAPFPEEDGGLLGAARRDRALLGDQLRQAWLDLLAAEVGARPLVLVLEDLHWGDVPSVQLLDAALRELADRPLLMLALARPEIGEIFPRLWEDCAVTHLGLPPLPRRASERLVAAVLGEAAGGGGGEAATLVERAAGNPFLLEELLRAHAAGARELPDTVLAMVQARLETLPVDARRVLRAASIFGERFRAAGLAALAGEESAAWLELLVERELVVKREGEHAFRHALVREAAYGTLTDEDRRAGHLGAALWLTEAGNRDERLVAGHFERGGALETAVPCFRRAAGRALDAGDLDATLECVARAVACSASGAELGRLRLLESQARSSRTEFAQARAAAGEAATCFVAGSPEWVMAAAEEASAAARLGDHAPMMRLAERLATMDWPERATQLAVTRLVSSLAWNGRVATARSLDERLPRPTADDPLLAAAVHRAHGYVAHALGARAAAIRCFSTAIEEYLRAGNRREAAQYQVQLAAALCDVGAFDRAEAVLGEARAVGERLRLPFVLADCLHNLGRALVERGELAAALEPLAAARARYVANGAQLMEKSARTWLGRAYLGAGRLEEAAREAAAAGARVLEARVALAAGDRERARTLASEARAGVAGLWEQAELVAILDELGQPDPALAAAGAAAVEQAAAELDDELRGSFLARPECRALLDGARGRD